MMHVTIDEIRIEVARHFRLQPSDLVARSRKRRIARPRQIAMWFARSRTTRSLPEIGRMFGGLDHTTVLHGIKRIDALVMVNPEIKFHVESIALLIDDGARYGLAARSRSEFCACHFLAQIARRVADVRSGRMPIRGHGERDAMLLKGAGLAA
jgi:hypothetical protein